MRLIGFSSRRSCHEVTDEVKAHDIMLFSVRHCVGRYALMPPIALISCEKKQKSGALLL